MRLFVGNFEFEHHLAGPRAPRLPDSVQRLSADPQRGTRSQAGKDVLLSRGKHNRQPQAQAGIAGLSCTLVACADEGDLLWMPAEPEDGFFERLAQAGLPRVRPVHKEGNVSDSVIVTPWGWTDAVRDWANRHGWSYVAPAQPVIRDVNSRRFSSRVEHDLSIALPGARGIHSLEELSTAVDRLPAGYEEWAVKAEFSMAARERILGRGRTLNSQTAGWVKRRLAADGVVFFEPWVEPAEELGIQFDVPQTGSPQLVGVTPLLTGTAGVYRGNRVGAWSDVEQHWSTAIDAAGRAVERIQKLGYFGPVGIDALRYRDPGGSIRERPLMDINARWTMGRLSLGLARLLEPGESATWLHVRWPTDDPQAPERWYVDVTDRLPSNVRVIRTSPFLVADRPTRHATLLLISPSAKDLSIAETTLLTSQSV